MIPSFPERWRAAVGRHLPWVSFAFLALVFVRPALGSGLVLSGSDWIRDCHYSFGLVGQELVRGRLPLWDSHILCGTPLLANLHSAVFYPPTWLAAVLPTHAFWTVAVFLHLFMAGCFAYDWMRTFAGRAGALAGAWVFMLAAHPVLHAASGHAAYLFAYPWLAAVLGRLERLLAGPSPGRVSLLAATLAMTILCGAPQYTFFALLAIAARLGVHLVREVKEPRPRRVAFLQVGLAVIGALLLAAPQLLPSWELKPLTHRAYSGSYEFVSSYSVPPENLLALAVPDLHGNGLDAPYWGRWNLVETCGYAGLATWLFVAFALTGRHPHRYLWAALALGGFLLALGRYGPLHPLLSAVLPSGDFFRAPGRFLAVATLSLAALAALGCDRLWNGQPSGRSEVAVAVGAGGAALALFVVALCLGMSEAADDWAARMREALSRPDASPLDARTLPATAPLALHAARRGAALAAVGLAVAAGILLARRSSLLSFRAATVLLALLLVSDLVLFGSRFLRAQSAADLDWPADFVRSVRERPDGPLRLVTVGGPAQDAGRARKAGLDHVGGNEVMLLRSYVELMAAVHEAPVEEGVVIILPGRPHPVLRRLGARLWMVYPGAPAPPGARLVGSLGSVSLFEWDEALPRAHVVPTARSIPAPTERLRSLAQETFDPRQVVVLEKETGAPPGGPGTVRILEHGSGSYRMEVDAPQGGFLVLAESFYPGWEAAIDGRPAEILRADHFLQAVRLEPGRHAVEFRYRCARVRAGLAVAGLAVAGAVTWLLLARRLHAPLRCPG